MIITMVFIPFPAGGGEIILIFLAAAHSALSLGVSVRTSERRLEDFGVVGVVGALVELNVGLFGPRPLLVEACGLRAPNIPIDVPEKLLIIFW